MKKLSFLFAFMSMLLVATTESNAKNYVVPNHADWMSNLYDSIPIRKVSIPGAHDAATGTVNLAGTSCQNLNVNELFDAGVRYFDFRTGFTSGIEMRMYHGFVDVSRTFIGVMNDLYNKLEEHQDEFVIVEVTIESDTKQKDNCKDHLKSYFRPQCKDSSRDVCRTYWKKESDYNRAKSKWMYFRPDLTVGDARGRVILLFNDEYDKPELMAGPYIPGRGDGPGSIAYIKCVNPTVDVTVHSQNDYHEDVFDNDVTLKFYNYVRPEIEQFTQIVEEHPDSMIWCMNFLSAYIHLIPNQWEIAGPVNALFAQYVNQHPQCYLGIVLMDYCGCPIWKNMASDTVNGDIALEAVINNNRRYWDEKKIYGDGKKDRREPFEMNSNE